MKRRILTILFALTILAGVIPRAQAASLFPPSLVYQNQFADVSSSAWYYENVAALYSLGLTNGKTSATFAPDSDITVAEVLTMAARLRSLHEFGAAETGASLFRKAGDIWYAPYTSYLRSRGIIQTEFDTRFDKNATRAEMAHILANTLPADLFPAINMDTVTVGYAKGDFITDVTEYTPYQQDILTLYRWGILSGTDASGSFCPAEPISRCEVAAMVSRMVESDLRITLRWDVAEEEQVYLSLADLVTGSDAPPAAPDPSDPVAVDAALRYMLARGEKSLTLHYPTAMTQQSATAVMQAFLSAVRRYPEQCYNRISVSYSTSGGKVVLSFSSSLYDKIFLDSYRELIFSAAVKVRDSLYAAGLVTNTMTQYEKAKAYFTWLCNNCSYDNNADSGSMSHSAYNVFLQKIGVCDGYTAAYNLLLKLEGIPCVAIERTEWDHMWTIATLDGVNYHIDPTWGDQTNTIAYSYFAMTEAFSFSRFQ